MEKKFDLGSLLNSCHIVIRGTIAKVYKTLILNNTLNLTVYRQTVNVL